MSIATLPESVRKSALSLALDEKVNQPQPVSFDYWAKFKDLRAKVAAQVGEMKVLFPEFTPHDEPQHLARLFGIADKLIGSDRYARMNAAELFLLACGLYAHDWGMAVGREELEYLRSFCNTPTNPEVFTPLDDEVERLEQFVKQHGIAANELAENPVLSDDQLRQYVRETHAWRSGVRVRAFFHAAGSGVPQALDRVCQGHWLDFSQLDDEQRFSGQQGVLGDTVNLRAVAIYVRLVDLLDIADDRTPYAVWRFVAPADGRSSMEWKKHRALSPVTFPQHGDGRCVRFDGSTTDPEVWAELEDLRRYCEEQINGCMDLLARHHDERHQLDIRRLDWKVTAERFKPVNIRFEFHRERMFSILADEIYQGDSHVFLRELLQNSIDAVRMRKALLEQRTQRQGTRRNVGLGFDDAIYFTVTHREKGDATVVCRDEGIGMDDYVVRNYLAVAGVSYYQSEDFRRQGLNMDPISRFGVGILSCFMVAKRIEIDTCREPASSEARQALKIDIPAVDKQFRIYTGPADCDIGTKVTVHVLGGQLRDDVKQKHESVSQSKPGRLQVTEYLKAIAGFVESPIVVDEDGVRTVILHPNSPVSDAEPFQQAHVAMFVWQKPTAYAWDHAFAPQDAHLAARHLKEAVFDLKTDLGLDDYQGSVSYIVPVDESARLSKSYYGAGADEGLVVTSLTDKVHIRMERTYGNPWERKEGLSRSSQSNHGLSVYRDGLLVPDVIPPNRASRYDGLDRVPWPAPKLRVNLPKNLGGIPDVSRRTLLRLSGAWDEPIWREITNRIANHQLPGMLAMSVLPRIQEISKLAHLYHLTSKEIVTLVPSEKWPLPVIISIDGAQIQDQALSQGCKFWAVPESISEYIDPALGLKSWSKIDSESAQAVLQMWRSETSIYTPEGYESHYAGDQMMSFWLSLVGFHFARVLRPCVRRFVKPQYPGLPLISQMQFVYTGTVSITESQSAEAIMLDPLTMNGDAKIGFRSLWWTKEARIFAEAVPFEPPFDKFFAGSAGELNLEHPLTQLLVRCAAATRWGRLTKPRRSAEIGMAEDQLNIVAGAISDPDRLNKEVKVFVEILKSSGLVNSLVEINEVSQSDYLPTLNTAGFVWQAVHGDNKWDKQLILKLMAPHLREFGQPLTTTEPEEAPAEVITVIQKLRRITNNR